MTSVTFRVDGIARTQGSMTRAGSKMRHSNKHLDAWRKAVGWAALRAMKEKGYTLAGKNVRFAAGLIFRFQAESAFRTGRNDLDKLTRAIFDSVAGVIFPDDSSVYAMQAWKELGEESCLIAHFWEIDDLPPVSTREHKWIELPF